jgi:hypothetical protein
VRASKFRQPRAAVAQVGPELRHRATAPQADAGVAAWGRVHAPPPSPRQGHP